MTNRIVQLQRFNELFSRSTIAPDAFFVRGSRFRFRECYYGSLPYPEHWIRVIHACRRLELPGDDVESSSPVNATVITHNFPFLDGGMISRQGDYFVGMKGMWIIGVKAVRFICYELEIEQPRRFRGEDEVRSYRELLAEIFWQYEETPEGLERLRLKLDRFT